MTGPHDRAPIATSGASLTEAAGALVLVHGRGATAQGILGLADEFGRADLAVLAPQAAGGTWYPTSFLAPIEANEPHLSSAVGAVMGAVAQAEAAGIGRERIALGGFSQGACLALETAARHAGRWGAVFALSGGLIGTGPGDGPPLRGMGGSYPAKAFDYDGSMDGTPVFVGGSDVDPHIPLSRMEQTAEVFRQLGASVDLRAYPGFGHAINRDEVEAVGDMLSALSLPPPRRRGGHPQQKTAPPPRWEVRAPDAVGLRSAILKDRTERAGHAGWLGRSAPGRLGSVRGVGGVRAAVGLEGALEVGGDGARRAALDVAALDGVDRVAVLEQEHGRARRLDACEVVAEAGRRLAVLPGEDRDGPVGLDLHALGQRHSGAGVRGGAPAHRVDDGERGPALGLVNERVDLVGRGQFADAESGEFRPHGGDEMFGVHSGVWLWGDRKGDARAAVGLTCL